MTYIWGAVSAANRDECHAVLKNVLDSYIKIVPFDCSIICGWRSKEIQNELFKIGRSKVEWPNSKHNKTDLDGNPESWAVDMIPYRLNGQTDIPWKDPMPWAVMHGAMCSAATLNNIKAKGFTLRWGGDWDSDWTWKDQSFHDRGHWELKRIEQNGT